MLAHNARAVQSKELLSKNKVLAPRIPFKMTRAGILCASEIPNMTNGKMITGICICSLKKNSSMVPQRLAMVKNMFFIDSLG